MQFQSRTPFGVITSPPFPFMLRRLRFGVHRLAVGEVVLPSLEEDVLARRLPRCHKLQPRRERLVACPVDAVTRRHGGEAVPLACWLTAARPPPEEAHPVGVDQPVQPRLSVLAR
eukprot:339551-Prymnesium_polylepis.2